MGNANSIKKLNFEDIQDSLNKDSFLIISTISSERQECLLPRTLSPSEEIKRINECLKNNKKINIILYGENCNCDKLREKYLQLVGLGFVNVYVYLGGLFEWLLLQDIYGEDEFPTTNLEKDLLKFKSKKIL